ncbi:MAG: tetratricopeptide repeat protein [Candidatus Abyssubacteria bacterium]|nr:tetratricopeptide repeat protein [Candidatus Abyssubacteria bacterium]
MQATKELSPLPSRAERQETASRPEAIIMEKEKLLGYGRPAGAVIENGMSATKYELHAMTGDDMAADSIAPSAPIDRARGFGGGEYAEEQLRDSKVLLRAPAPVAKLEPERLALKSIRSSIGRLDSKDSSIVASVDEGFIPAESAKTPAVTFEQQEPAAAESTEILLEKGEIKKEMSVTIGGKTYYDGRKSDLDTAVDEFARSNVDFDRREFNEAVMNYRDAVGMEADKQFSAKAMHRLGGTYQELDQCESAISVYEAVIEEHPDYPDLADVYLAVGECYLAMGKAEDAVRNFEIVSEKFPAKRELALQKISAAASMQETSEKTNEAQAEEQE